MAFRPLVTKTIKRLQEANARKPKAEKLPEPKQVGPAYKTSSGAARYPVRRTDGKVTSVSVPARESHDHCGEIDRSADKIVEDGADVVVESLYGFAFDKWGAHAQAMALSKEHKVPYHVHLDKDAKNKKRAHGFVRDGVKTPPLGKKVATYRDGVRESGEETVEEASIETAHTAFAAAAAKHGTDHMHAVAHHMVHGASAGVHPESRAVLTNHKPKVVPHAKAAEAMSHIAHKYGAHYAYHAAAEHVKDHAKKESVNEDGGPSAAAKILARAEEKGLVVDPPKVEESEHTDYAAAAKAHGEHHMLDTIPSHLHGAAGRHAVAARNAHPTGHGDGSIPHPARQAMHDLVQKHGAHKVLVAAHAHASHEKVKAHLHAAVQANESAEGDIEPSFLDRVMASAAGKAAEVSEAKFAEEATTHDIPKERMIKMHTFAKKMRYNGTTTAQGREGWHKHAQHLAKRLKDEHGVHVESEEVAGTTIGEASAAFADIIEPESLVVETLSHEDHVVHVKYHLRSTEQAKKTVHHLVGAAMNHGAHGHDAEGYDGHVKFHFKHHDAAKHFANHAKAVAHVHTVAHNKPDESAGSTIILVPYDASVGALALAESRVVLTQDMGQASPQLEILLAQFGGKVAEGGGYEFQEPSKAQSFLNMYMVHGGRGYIRVPKSQDNPDGKAGPNEAVDIDEVPGSFLASVLNAASVDESAFLKLNESDFEALRAARDHAAAREKAASDKLRAHPRNHVGLTPDHIKATPEWQKDRADHASAFAHLRHINQKLTAHPEYKRRRKAGERNI